MSVCRSVEDSLLLREFEQAREAALTSDATLLVAAEGRGDVARGVVDVDVARVDALCDRDRLGLRRGVHVARESVGRVVGD